MDKTRAEELATILDEPIGQYTIPVWNYTKWDKLLRRPKFKVFTLYKCRVTTMLRVSMIANSIKEIDADVKTMEDLTKIGMPLIEAHTNDFIYVVACCIQNNMNEPESSLISFLRDNLSAEMLFELVYICLNQTGLMSFISATALIKGTSVSFASGMDVQAASEQDTSNQI